MLSALVQKVMFFHKLLISFIRYSLVQQALGLTSAIVVIVVMIDYVSLVSMSWSATVALTH